MHVGALVLEDFRNYHNESVELSEGLNLVMGRNAQGKTNLLEAVHCLSGLGSPRSPDSALVREGAEHALIHADVTRGPRTVHVDMEFRPGRGARALINRTAVPSMKALGDLAVTVFFGPDELSLVKGSPDGRRRFLDELIVKLRPAQQALRKEWERVLKQRNALLRSLRGPGPTASETLEVWDEAFCKAGAALGAARLRALARLTPHSSGRYEDVAGGGAIELTYVSSWCTPELARAAMEAPDQIDEGALAAALQARIDQVKQGEIERGMSLAGPGRDDVTVRLQTQGGSSVFLDARTHASQGDQRTAALALKLGEHDLLTDILGDPPVLLLDDVFSELDPQRRAWLRDAVKAARQTLLSSAETEGWAAVAAERVFEVSQGRVTLVSGAS